MYRLQLRASTRRFTPQNHITFFFTGTTQDCATALLVVGPSPQGVSQLRYRLQLRASTRRFTQTHVTLFTGTTQDCATALLVTVGPSPHGVSQLRYRLQLRCFHEAFPYLRWRYRLQLGASMRSSHSYHTFYGHHPGWCNCPVSSGRFATGGISVEISVQLRCLHEVFSYLSLRYQLQHNTWCLWVLLFLAIFCYRSRVLRPARTAP